MVSELLVHRFQPRRNFRRLRTFGFCLTLAIIAFPSWADAQSLVQVRVAWDASTSPDVTGYVVDYGTSPGSYTRSVDVGASTQATVTGLLDGNTYYMAVRAYDSDGIMSPRSNEVVFTTPAACRMDFSTASRTIGGRGGSGNFALSTPSGCTWSLGSSANWLTLNASTGLDSATVTYSVAPNTSTQPRVGIIYSALRSFVVTQTGRMKADIDNDGSNDLLWQNDVTGEVSVWRMRGTSIVRGEYLNPNNVGDVNWRLAGTLDVDRDGHTDLLFQHTNGSVSIWRMNGDTRVQQIVLANSMTDPNWRIVGAADMDRNGSDDIFWQHTDGRLIAWYMNGSTRLQEATIVVLEDARWRVAAMEDFNNDGRIDILWRHTTWGQFLVWYMDNRSFLGSGMHLIMANAQWQVAAVGDYSGDGRLDIIWQNRVTGEIAAWLLDAPNILAGVSLNPGRVSDTNWRIAGPR